MMRSGTIDSLVNGVSQQPPEVRLPSQANAQENLLSDVAEGLSLRPPTELLAALGAGPVDSTVFIYTINRSPTEQYVVVVKDSGTPTIRVFDLDGNEATVSKPDGVDYLNCTADPKESLTAMTVADTTFILNRETAAAMDSATTDEIDGPEYLIYVAQTSYATEYEIRIDGVQEALYKTQNDAIDDTITIASELKTDLDASSNLSGWTISRSGNVLFLKAPVGNTDSVRIRDGIGGVGMKLVGAKIQKFTDLPPRNAADGFITEITGTNADRFDNYFVKWDADENIWKETVKPGVKYQLDATKLPHILERTSVSPLEFEFREAEWDNRKVGDNRTAPLPSFVNKEIRDIILFKNRLGLVSEESVVFSRADDLYNFFPRTVTAVLDDDPIDIEASTKDVANYRHAVLFDRRLLLFGDEMQSEVSGGDLFTPKSASLDQLSAYRTDNVRPVLAQQSVFFASSDRNSTSVWEYLVADDTVSRAVDISAHIPRYLPKNPTKLVSLSREGLIGMISDEDPAALYVYRYFNDGQRSLMASWSRWEFPGVEAIRDVSALDGSLVFVFDRGSNNHHLEKLSFSGVDDGDLDLRVHLDQRVDAVSWPGVDPPLQLADGRVIIACPWLSGEAELLAGNFVAVILSSDPEINGRMVSGLTWDTSLAIGRQVVLPAQKSGAVLDEIIIGRVYDAVYEFSPLRLKSERDGAVRASSVRRLQWKRSALVFERAGSFTAEVETEGGTYEYPSTDVVGSQIIGKTILRSGRHPFKVGGNARATLVRAKASGPAPVTFTSLEWEALAWERQRR